MTKRTKKKVLTGVTPEAYNKAIAAYAEDDAYVQTETAKLDAKITKLREQHAEKISAAEERKKENFNVVEAYCMENRTQMFDKKRSVVTAHGTVGFRIGKHKIKTLSGYTLKSALELIKVKLPKYVRTVEEIDKQKIIAERESSASPDVLESVGLQVVQDETFFVELKKEELQED